MASRMKTSAKSSPKHASTHPLTELGGILAAAWSGRVSVPSRKQLVGTDPRLSRAQ